MKYVSGIMCIMTCLLLCPFPSNCSDIKAQLLIDNYTKADNNENLSWNCFVNDAIALAKENDASSELVAALERIRDVKSAKEVANKLKPFGDEVKTKLPSTFEKMSETYPSIFSLWKLKGIVENLMKRNGKAACEKTHMKDEL